MPSVLLHASCVGIHGKGVLILGASGAGKSDLALRLIDSGAKLVADDYVEIDDALLASPPTKTAGLIEVRGVGILTLPYLQTIKLALAVQLVAHEAVERLPEPQFYDCLGTPLPLLSLHAYDASTPAKIRAYLLQKG